MAYPKLIEDLIDRFSRLPGVGKRSAERMVFWLLNHSYDDAKGLSDAIINLKDGLKFCRICNNLCETEICMICSDTSRDSSIVCVVEEPKDLLAIERSGSFNGMYHVLLGNISPTEGRGPDSIRIQQLVNRAGSEDIKEVVIATDPDNEGEMTALYIVRQLSSLPVKVSRIGVGLPMGSAVEFADISTLGMSLRSRREVTV